MADVQGGTVYEKFWERGTPNQAQFFEPKQAQQEQQGIFKVIAEREHPYVTARKCQIEINLLGLKGGRPYIDKRLSRFPGETKEMFEGGTVTLTGQKITGRREQAHVIPYLERIVTKTNQYLFGGGRIKREGVEDAEEVVHDITRTGTSLTSLMKRVTSNLMASKWCWLGIDAPTRTGAESMADAESMKLRPYWNFYGATDVVDWQFDNMGKLVWLLTEQYVAKGDNPMMARSHVKVRRLWERGSVTTFVYKKDGTEQKIVRAEGMELPFVEVPFVLCGEPSKDPITFDSLEGIHRTIMDLNSASRQNYFESMYAQIYLPASVKEALQESRELSNVTKEVAGALGMHVPIFLQEGDPTPGIITPNNSSFESVRKEAGELKVELFETAGLMLSRAGRQVESAEAKAWDHFDIENSLADMAQQCEEIETRAVAVSRVIDSTFPEWTPSYPRKFRVQDLAKDLQMYIMLGQIDLPEALAGIQYQRIMDTLDQMGGQPLTAEQVEEAKASIQNFVASGGMAPVEPPE
jgi:hypothetical protein